MKISILAFFTLLMIIPLSCLSATSRTYTETVIVKITEDEYFALTKAKERAKEQALKRYLDETYKDRSGSPDLTGEDKYIQNLEVVESNVSGMFTKELSAKIRVTINEEEVRSYLKSQGAIVGKNEERRIFVILIPGKIDSGDAPFILDNVRAEIRNNLTTSNYTVIDSEEQTKRLESLSEEADYSNLVGQLDGLGEWVVIGKVDIDVNKEGSMRKYHALMTGKAVNISSRDLMWEGNIDGLASTKASDSPKSGLRLAAIDGGRAFANKVLNALNTKTLSTERRGSRFEAIFPTAGDYKLERKILKLMQVEIKGLKEVNQKNRGKGDMVVDLAYVGKISELVDLLLDNFERDPQLERLNPSIEGNKIVFKN